MRQISLVQIKMTKAGRQWRLVQLLFAFALVLLMMVSAWAYEPAAAAGFDGANKLYEQGKYEEAASAYKQLIQSGQTSAAVFYNLGNAFFKSGQIGRALAAYHKAERLTPRDPDLRANLQFARNQVQGPTLATSAWERWLRRLTLNEWTALAGILLWVWMLLLGALQWRPTLKPAMRWYTILCGLALALACGLVVVSWQENVSNKTGIVIAHETVVRQGPLEESKSTFTLHDGAELQVLDRKDDWVQVATDPRRIGWVHRDQVLLGPEI